MTVILPAQRSGRYSIASHLTVSIMLATLPLATLGIWLEVLEFDASTATARTGFHEAVDKAAVEASATLNRVQSVLTTLALDTEVRSGTEQCRQRLRDAQRQSETIAGITRYNVNSAAACAANDLSSQVAIATQPWWSKARQQAQFQVARPIVPDKPSDATMLAVLTIKTPSGSFDGTLTADLSKAALPSLLRSAKTQSSETVYALWDNQHTVVFSNDEQNAEQLFGATPPPSKSLTPTHPILVAGTEWIVSIADVRVSGLRLSMAVTKKSLYGDARHRVFQNIAIIVTLLLLTNTLFIVATIHRITGWVGALKVAAVAPLPAHTNALALNLRGAPMEFRELGSALLTIIHQMNQRNTDLETAALKQTELAREIHHRVANTLQIVMSLMNLQAHRVQSPDARHALEQARARVNTLALANRIVDLHFAQDPVDLQRVVEETAAQTIRQAEQPPGSIHVETTTAACEGTAATAIPLALFVNEALAHALEHGSITPQAHQSIAIALTRTAPDEMTLAIRCGGMLAGSGEEQFSENLRPLLMKALAMQLSARLSPIGQEKSAGNITLAFPVMREA